MDELLYKTLTRYFKVLTHTGYKSYDVVFKFVVMDFIYDLFHSPLRWYITNKDTKLMQDLLYQFLGSTCEISFPTNNRPCCICICSGGDTPDPEPTEVTLTINASPSGSKVTINGTERTTITVPEGTSVSYRVEKVGYITQSDTIVLNSDRVLNIVLKQEVTPVNPLYMYAGISEEVPDENEIKTFQGYDYNNTKTFDSPLHSDWEQGLCIWFAIPSSVTLHSVENNYWQGDYLYNVDTGENLFTGTSHVTVDSVDYTVYYKTVGFPLNINFKVIVQ